MRRHHPTYLDNASISLTSSRIFRRDHIQRTFFFGLSLIFFLTHTHTHTDTHRHTHSPRRRWGENFILLLLPNTWSHANRVGLRTHTHTDTHTQTHTHRHTQVPLRCGQDTQISRSAVGRIQGGGCRLDSRNWGRFSLIFSFLFFLTTIYILQITMTLHILFAPLSISLFIFGLCSTWYRVYTQKPHGGDNSVSYYLSIRDVFIPYLQLTHHRSAVWVIQEFLVLEEEVISLTESKSLEAQDLDPSITNGTCCVLMMYIVLCVLCCVYSPLKPACDAFVFFFSVWYLLGRFVWTSLSCVSSALSLRLFWSKQFSRGRISVCVCVCVCVCLCVCLCVHGSLRKWWQGLRSQLLFEARISLFYFYYFFYSFSPPPPPPTPAPSLWSNLFDLKKSFIGKTMIQRWCTCN